MNTIKHQVVAVIGATAFALALASGCGSDVDSAPSEIGNNQQEPAPAEPRFQSPDSIDRPKAPQNSVDSAPCVFSADAAERLGRAVCQS